MNLLVTFEAAGVRLPGDHLNRIDVAASDGLLPAAAMRDAYPSAAPPEIRTAAGAVVFVSAGQGDEFDRSCSAWGVPVRKRPDVWGELLEPFVDTAFTPERRSANASRLAGLGLPAARVEAVRVRVGPLMRAYNLIHWDWNRLGLADLLDAASCDYLPVALRESLGSRPALHAWSMGLAAAGDG